MHQLPSLPSSNESKANDNYLLSIQHFHRNRMQGICSVARIPEMIRVMGIQIVVQQLCQESIERALVDEPCQTVVAGKVQMLSIN